MTDASSHNIGTLREKPLHASLKSWYAREGDLVETPVDGFVIDLVRDDLLIEVQTRGFSSMRAKVEELLDGGHRVLIVHPIAVDRWIIKVDDDTILPRRLSPRHGAVTDVFGELVSFPELLVETSLEIEVVLTREEEYRKRTADRSWRRRGWSVVERRLLEVVGTTRIDGVYDLAALLPRGLPEPFTTSDLAAGLESTRRSAQQMAYCLRKTGVIVMAGKRGNAVEYLVAGH